MRILRAIGSLIWNLVFLIFMYWVWSTGTLVGYLFFGGWCFGIFICAIELIFDFDISDYKNKSAAMSQAMMSQEDDEWPVLRSHNPEYDDCGGINPATGLPMIGIIDSGGHFYGSS